MKRILTLALIITMVQFSFAQSKDTEGLKRIDQGSETSDLSDLNELSELSQLSSLSELSSLTSLSSLSALSELSSLSQLSSLAELSEMEIQKISIVMPAIELGLAEGLGAMLNSLDDLDITIERSVLETMDSIKIDQIIEEAIEEANKDKE